MSRKIALAATLTAGLLSTSAFGATLTWTNAGSGSNISTKENWKLPDNTIPAAGPVTGDHLIFADQSLGNPTWNSSINVTLDLTDGGWNFNVSSRLYTSGLLDYSTANLGLSTFSDGSSDSRVGSNGTSEWNIGTGNTLLVTSDRLELNQNLTKSGSGKLVLAATSSGGNRGIAVTGGTVLVNMISPTASNSDWSVSAGATLGGTGTVRSNRAAGIAVAGTLAPGGDGTYGTIIETIEIQLGATNRSVAMSSGSTFAVDFGAADQSDLLTITDGIFDLSAANNILNITGPSSMVAGSYPIYSGNNSGTFESILYNGTSVAGNSDFSIAYNTSDITVTIVPEPATLSLAALSVLGLARRRRQA